MCMDSDLECTAQEWSPGVAGIQRVGPGLRELAEALLKLPEQRCPHVGFIGYGDVKPGDKVLFAVDTHYEPEVVSLVVDVLRTRGARVDVLWVDVGPDREFDDLDEIRVVIRKEHWSKNPRRWEGLPWVEELAERHGYHLLIHGKGGPVPNTPYRYEQFPFLRTEHLAQGAHAFPAELHRLINRKTWEKIWVHGRGAKVRLMDPEGTDITWTLHEGYYAGDRRGFTADPVRHYGHLHGHPPTPILPEEDATGVIAGTTSHFGRPFPLIRLYLEAGRLERVEGGGRYGQAWQELLEATRHIHYPCFPREGLFWLWECAIGTNPRIRRPSNIHQLSSGGFEWERRRSGIIHIGIGTRWRGPEEAWAAERGLTYGHLHVHLLFPTYEILKPDGTKVKVIDHGRLVALDDPEVRECARKYGDPDELLKEDWVPSIPGINAPGSFEDYARDPARYIYGGLGSS
jgi:hypothetical protein